MRGALPYSVWTRRGTGKGATPEEGACPLGRRRAQARSRRGTSSKAGAEANGASLVEW